MNDGQVTVTVSRETLEVARDAVHRVGLHTADVAVRSRLVTAGGELEALLLRVDAQLYGE